MTYDILIENRRAVPVTVFNLDGSALCRIGPGDSFRCSADDPYLPLARYERITFKTAGVDLSIRSDWTEPERKWPVLLELRDGPAVEHRFFNGSQLTLMRGIPVIVDCPPQHEWAICDKVLLNVAEQRRVESAEHDGIYEFVPVLADQPVLRTEAELERLQREIETMANAVPSQAALTPEDRADADKQEDEDEENESDI